MQILVDMDYSCNNSLNYFNETIKINKKYIYTSKMEFKLLLNEKFNKLKEINNPEKLLLGEFYIKKLSESYENGKGINPMIYLSLNSLIKGY